MRVGVDEAGKGPVLGPMVVAAVGVLADDAASAVAADVLPDGVADSKRLAPDRREDLAAALRGHDRIRIGVAAVSVERIDDPVTDMNSLTVAGHAEALAALADDCEPDPGDGAGVGAGAGDEPADAGTDAPLAGCRVLADAGDTSEERFARRLREACADRIGAAATPEITARHGADDADPVVAAASIVAKVERDARVAELAAEYGDVGSGYPGDETTRAFLREWVREHGELPDCARTSWGTCDDVLAAAEQAALGEF